MERLEAESSLAALETSVLDLLIAQDEADERGVILEVRSGTGGDEASLFASEIFKMYGKYAVQKGWKWDELSSSRSEIGGFKEAQAAISGESVYKMLKFESGVHRVQRIPVNDKVIQTSACSVIVMPEASEVDVVLRPQDLRIDVFRAGGAGGQSVNKTESAVRITHLPTGLKIEMQDERSQIQNRARAMKYLHARVYDYEREKHIKAQQQIRNEAGGTGDRSDKIRTYNFPQDRVTDHRAGKTVTGVERVMNGLDGLDSIVDALGVTDRQSKIEAFLDELE
jgi:peptide chain release factor 1